MRQGLIIIVYQGYSIRPGINHCTHNIVQMHYPCPRPQSTLTFSLLQVDTRLTSLCILPRVYNRKEGEYPTPVYPSVVSIDQRHDLYNGVFVQSWFTLHKPHHCKDHVRVNYYLCVLSIASSPAPGPISCNIEKIGEPGDEAILSTPKIYLAFTTTATLRHNP